MEQKKIFRSTLIGFFLLAISMGLTILLKFLGWLKGGVVTQNGKSVAYGLRAAFENYIMVWRPKEFPHFLAYVACVLIFIAIALGLVTIILALAKKKPVLILTGLFLTAAVGYLPYIFILVIPMVELNVIGAKVLLMMTGITGLNLFAIYFLWLPVSGMLKGLVNAVAGKKKECCKNKGLDEEAVRALVQEGVDAHVEEYHSEEEPAPAPAPVKEEKPAPEPEPEPEEEPVEEEPEEEEEAEEEPAAETELAGGLVIKGKRRRASFETRLRNSEFDLRHKYYDLRDYIKWYGMRNRVSIPGDTFSYKRQRYVFVTIIGKHIRVYLDLNPSDYADSTIPVEPSAAKKYEDLPCLLRVKSNLSYRRAKKLVDDVMKKVGLEKPDTDEPKETQNNE